MKKNGINAFKGIEQSMYQIFGGTITEDCMTASGQEDCITLTEPGETYNGIYNEYSEWNVQDAMEIYSIVAPGDRGATGIRNTSVS